MKLIPALFVALLSFGCASTGVEPYDGPDNFEGELMAVRPTCADAERYLKIWQKRFRLNGWEIEFKCMVPPGGDDHYAEVEVETKDKNVTLYFNPGHDTKSLAMDTIIHELLHIIVFDIKEVDSEVNDERAVRILTRWINKCSG